MPEFVMNEKDECFSKESDFVAGYIEAMFFTETAPGTSIAEWYSPEMREDIAEGRIGGSLPEDAGYDDIHPDSLASIIKQCADFQEKAADFLRQAYERGYDEAQAGRDFWYTRNGHGVGYWDRKELEADGLGEKLSKLCRFDSAHVWFADHVTYGSAPYVHHD